jgi:preprotein translocase subunit SecE
MATKVTEKQDATIKPKKEKPRATAAPSAAAQDSFFARTSRYLREVQVELRKTTWPSKQELIASTQVVMGLLVVVGVYMWLADVILGYLFRAAGMGLSK